MNTFLLKISSPEGDLFCGQAICLRVRGTEGDLAVLAGHIPFISSVKPCDCIIDLEDETERVGHVDGGILTVASDAVRLLSGSFVWKD